MQGISQPGLKIFLLTSLALIAFAANSVLCRLALGPSKIDPASFTIIRLLSGAIVLFIILKVFTKNQRSTNKGSWSASFMLFFYAVTFSFAYISLETGTGALILFGAVQISIIFISLLSGNRLHGSEWIGVLVAFFGFVYLILPGLTSPSVIGFVLMTIAGIAWGIYTLKGRSSENPLMDTTYNFLRTIPLVLLLALWALPHVAYSFEGILLAAVSGGIASGMGYTIWYQALGGLSATEAAVVQLFVPIIAALGGVIFVNEPITLRLTLAALLILGGILVVVVGRTYYRKVG